MFLLNATYRIIEISPQTGKILLENLDTYQRLEGLLIVDLNDGVMRVSVDNE